MSFGTALYTIFLKPLEMIFELIYNAAYQNIQNPGLSIIALSLAINFLVLPLYMRADAIQKEERDTEAKLDKWVRHIKKAFRGDERTMMLQTYYRQNNYSPFYVLRSSISLVLQIPFFTAAYRFLSKLELLEGASFGPIADLSKPDGLIVIGALSINILPILMTCFNLVSCIVYSRDCPLKTKLQLYGMAAFFLVFLYNSPSGLAFYWTLNNVFSLIKNVFYKLKHAKEVLCVLAATVGTATLYWAARLFTAGTTGKAIFITVCGIALWVPLITMLIKKKSKLHFSLPERKPSTKSFILSGLFLSVLIGLVIPSAVLKASPQEFIDLNYFVHPLWYLAYSFLTAFGLFIVWFGVFYWLTAPKAKPIFEGILWSLCGVAVVDYLFFGTDLGTMSADLIFDTKLSHTATQMLVNGGVLVVTLAVLTLLFIKWKKVAPGVLSVVLIAFLCMSVLNGIDIRKSVAAIDKSEMQTQNTEAPHFSLSKTGKNVVVIMLDRAMGEYVPYIFNEKPELKEKFSGFTYYSNTISFGGHTNFATPALFGGYEYTPVELNKRNTESLKDKHNEALKVMPTLFADAGYDVTVFDPPYAGYRSIPDLSIYDGNENISAYISDGYFTGTETRKKQISTRNRNFFCYGLTKAAPLFAQGFLYDDGQYNHFTFDGEQTIESVSKATGKNSGFMSSYNTLQKMSDMTELTDEERGSFLMMSNDITHNSALLSEPDYTPSNQVDNTAYDDKNKDRFTLNGKTVKMTTSAEYAAYHTNVAAMIQLGNWFDWLREQGVYDNTRVILVADHGFALLQMDNFVLDAADYQRKIDSRLSDTEFYYPLLMVKDFDSTGFTTSDEFMTNADVPTLATEKLFEKPVNPLTGKLLNNAEKTAHPQYIIASTDFKIGKNKGNTFLPARWYSVHTSIWDKANWKLETENAILP